MQTHIPFRIRVASLFLLTALAPAIGGCINLFHQMRVRPLPPTEIRALDSTGTRIRSAVKAHLADGSTVVFPQGASVSGGQLTGTAVSYWLLSSSSVPRGPVPLDSIVGLEAFEDKILAAPSVVTSIAATAAGALATAALAVAIFGSCPTLYADSAGVPQLEAEGFSYAIAPMFEHRDVDRLTVRPDARGVIRLELRNEALETHFINQVELLEARASAGEVVLPDQASKPMSVAGLRPLTSATDRVGRDVRDLLSRADGRLFSSSATVVDNARANDLDDWIDFVADSLEPGDSVAVVLRLRNSLLNTVLLYDGMLGGRDAIDWIATDLQRISTVVDLSRWYTQTMGMRASIDDGDATARLNDVGPIAFRDVAIVLPRAQPSATRVRGRLRFVADNWRIDQIRIAAHVTRPEIIHHTLARVIVPTPADGIGPRQDTAAVTALRAADEQYLETRPGQRMSLEFDVPPGNHSATYAIAWQGWYREWIRGNWLAQPTRDTPFVIGDSAVAAALKQWRARQATFERAFYTSRLPVR